RAEYERRYRGWFRLQGRAANDSIYAHGSRRPPSAGFGRSSAVPAMRWPDPPRRWAMQALQIGAVVVSRRPPSGRGNAPRAEGAPGRATDSRAGRTPGGIRTDPAPARERDADAHRQRAIGLAALADRRDRAGGRGDRRRGGRADLVAQRQERQ